MGYAVSATRLTLHLTAHFQDSAGDHQDATVTMTYRLPHSQPPTDGFDGAVFNACPRGSSPAIAYLPAAGSWFSYFTPVPRARYNVSASWFDSGVETSSPPSFGSCQGSYQAGTRIDSAMNADLDSPQQGVIKVGRTAKFLLYVDGPDNLQIGTCDANNVEVLYDTVAYDIYSGVLKLSLPVRQLRRAGRRIVIPIDVRYSQRLPSNGDQGNDAGASTTLTAHWQGSITYSRSFTCRPNGCQLPMRYPPPPR